MGKKNDYKISATEYVMVEYFRTYDTSHFEKTLWENSDKFMDKGGVNYDMLSQFVGENIGLFSDEKMFQEIATKAVDIFNLKDNPEDLNPFSKTAIQSFLDYKHQYGGINLMKPTVQETYKELNSIVYPMAEKNLYREEFEHFEKLVYLTSNEHPAYQVLDAIDYGLNSMKNSGNYREALEFAQNHFNFQESGDMPIKYPVSAAGIAACAKVGGNVGVPSLSRIIIIIIIYCCCWLIIIIIIARMRKKELEKK